MTSMKELEFYLDQKKSCLTHWENLKYILYLTLNIFVPVLAQFSPNNTLKNTRILEFYIYQKTKKVLNSMIRLQKYFNLTLIAAVPVLAQFDPN